MGKKGKSKLIGREREIEILNEVVKSKEAEFVAIYGRRRVGKTCLIREHFSNQDLYLEVTGMKDAPLKKQLEHFTQTFSLLFHQGINIQSPKNWDAAFDMLTKQLINVPKNKKVILFLDELPWMATHKSGLLQAIDYFWNRHWSSLRNMILIVCGSAASWMLENLIFAKGGLHNRLTKRIRLEPFNLRETKAFLKSHSIKLKDKQILDLYMAIGGIPFYLKEIRKGKSIDQNLDSLCFDQTGLLNSEFNNLFASLFDQSEEHLKCVKEIVKSGNRATRDYLIRQTGIKSGGAINRRLDELEASGFIRRVVPYGKKRRDRFYRIIDEYTLFYLKWIEPLQASGAHSGQAPYWQKIARTPTRSIWAGYAFENVCLKHISQINYALGLTTVASVGGSWRYIPPKNSRNEQGAQVDLLFDRHDNAITLCEIKYCDRPFVINKSYAQDLNRKTQVFELNFPTKANPTKKQVFLAIIAPYGVKQNKYVDDMIDNQVTLDDLFK